MVYGREVYVRGKENVDIIYLFKKSNYFYGIGLGKKKARMHQHSAKLDEMELRLYMKKKNVCF